jgi:hypothetical protein
MLRGTPLLGLLVLASLASPVARAGVVVKVDPAAVAPDDGAALEALARLPEQTRRIALEAALHVPLLEEIGALNAETSLELEALVETLPTSQRDAAWALLSHPDLLASREGEAPSNDAEWKATVAELPPELLASALTVLAYEPDFFARIAALRAAMEARFEALLAPHPIETQATFRALLIQPDVLGLLTTHVELAAVLGSRYRDDPASTVALLASLGESLTRGDEDALPGLNDIEPDPDVELAYEESPAPAWPATLIANVMPIFTGSPGPRAQSRHVPAPSYAPSTSFWFGLRFDRRSRFHGDSWRRGLSERRRRDGTLRRERRESRHERRLRDSHESRSRRFERMRDRTRRGFDSKRSRGGGSVRYGSGEVRRGHMNAGRTRRGAVKRGSLGGGRRGP